MTTIRSTRAAFSLAAFAALAGLLMIWLLLASSPTSTVLTTPAGSAPAVAAVPTTTPSAR